MQTTNPLVMTLTESSNNTMSQMAQEGAKSGFFAGLLETAKSTISNNPIAVAAGVTAIGVAGIAWYGYRNWGWFGGSDTPAPEPVQLTEAEIQQAVSLAVQEALAAKPGLVDKATMEFVAAQAATVAPAAPAPAAAAPVAAPAAPAAAAPAAASA